MQDKDKRLKDIDFTVIVLNQLAQFIDSDMVKNARWFCNYDRKALRDAITFLKELPALYDVAEKAKVVVDMASVSSLGQPSAEKDALNKLRDALAKLGFVEEEQYRDVLVTAQSLKVGDWIVRKSEHNPFPVQWVSKINYDEEHNMFYVYVNDTAWYYAYRRDELVTIRIYLAKKGEAE